MKEQESPAVGGRNHASEVITSGHVWSAVWYVAWPTALNTLILTAYNVINGVFVGRLPNARDALAALGVGNAALMIQFALMMGVSVGTSALVARFVGAQEQDSADESAGQSIGLAILAGIVSGAPLILLARPIVSAIGAQGASVALASDYTAIIAAFSAPLFVYFVAQAVLRSAGDVRSPLYAGAATVMLNVLLDWLLIFGVWRFPALGIRGAAIATGISRIAGMAVSLWFLKKSILGTSFTHLRPRWTWWMRILNIGWPAMIQNLVWTGANVVFVRVLGWLGDQATAAQAAYTIALRIESLAFMPGIAYSTAATPLVGQNLGAGKPGRAVHTAWVATGQAVAIMSAVAVTFIVVPRWLAGLFTTEPSVVTLTVSYLRINAISEPFLAIGMVLRGALQGAGDTRAPMWLSAISLWLVRIPLSVLLAQRLCYGASGAWVAMSATTILSGILVAGWFLTGRWRKVRI